MLGMRVRADLLAVVIAVAASEPSRARAATDTQQRSTNGATSSGVDESDPDDVPAEAELVGELLATGDSEDDLAWLYSNADEYTPGDLTGDPIPAPSLPGPGRGTPRLWNPQWSKFGI